MYGNPKVLFVYRHLNSVIAADHGRFMNSDGKIYVFNYDYKFMKISNDELLEKFKKIMEDEDPSDEVNRLEIIDAYKLLSCISNIKFKTKITGFGSGQKTLYAICEGKYIELSTKGDKTGFIKLDTAQKIFDILKKNNFYDINSD